MSDHPLDRPVWSALSTRQRPLAQGDGRALRFDPRYGPFAAAADASPESLAALAALDPGEGGLRLAERRPFPAPPGLEIASVSTLVQMVARRVEAAGDDLDVVVLADADAPEMQALAALTRPGPFSTLTHRLGRFIGVRRGGVLAAMAGERMQPEGFCEVSGVCTHPDHRGHGHARALSSLVARRILARGETPFLHTYDSNAAAIALYESLGFRWRADIALTALASAGRGLSGSPPGSPG